MDTVFFSLVSVGIELDDPGNVHRELLSSYELPIGIPFQGRRIMNREITIGSLGSPTSERRSDTNVVNRPFQLSASVCVFASSPPCQKITALIVPLAGETVFIRFTHDPYKVLRGSVVFVFSQSLMLLLPFAQGIKPTIVVE